MLEKLRLIAKLFAFTFSVAFYRLRLLVSAKIHRWTYKSVANPKNVVVIGGSFGGFFLAKQLAESLPTGYRVVLIEKHSHFYFTWNFPRISVVSDQTHKAFIPYPKQPSFAPNGIYSFRQGTVSEVDVEKVVLEDGSQIPFEFLAVATGSRARYPAGLEADEKAECIKFFQARQDRIKEAKNIVVVGGGAAGVEVAGDIKTKYPTKTVTLIHSRDRLLNSFGEGLHEIARGALQTLGVNLHLGERVTSDVDAEFPKEVTLRGGKIIPCDALIKCTGQSSCSNLIKQVSPSSISPSGAVLVEGTLQLQNSPSPNIFALGDVIDSVGPKMGRAASLQGMFVAENIVRAIKKRPLKTYTPSMVDTSIELTLGLEKSVTYIADGTADISFSKTMADEAMHAAQAWKLMGMKPFEDPGQESKVQSA